MIAFSKNPQFMRMNPILGAGYEMKLRLDEKGAVEKYLIEFFHSNGKISHWAFETKEAAEQTLEWLDNKYQVQFIPDEILETENE